MDQIENAIRTAIMAKDDPDFEARSGVYKSALRALDKISESEQTALHKISESEQTALRSRLIDVVKEIEGEFERDAPSTFFEVDMDGLEASKPNANSGRKRPGFLKLPMLIFGLLVIAGLVVPFSLGWLDQTETVTETASPSESLSKLQSDSSEPTSKFLYDIKLPDDIDQLAGNALGRSSDRNSYEKFVTGSTFLVNDDVSFFIKDLMPVDTSKVYLMRLTMRVKEIKTKWPRIQAGFATFDAEKKVQRDPPGSHRYFAHQGLMRLENTIEVGDEFSVSGVISGEGNTSHNMLRPGTRYIRPLAFFRVDDDTSILQITNIEVMVIN